MRRFVRLSLRKQLCIALLTAALAAGAAIVWGVGEHATSVELERARSVADVLDALRIQASRANGFYVRRDSSQDPAAVGRYLASVDVVTQGPETQRTETFHQKNPFLVLTDLSAELRARSESVSFRMVSDNPMNPANMADAVEAAALRALRRSDAAEAWQVVGPDLRYVRPLQATEACLRCHGDQAKAPAVVRTSYPPPAGAGPGGGYGFQVGQVMGLTSVTLKRATKGNISGPYTAAWVAPAACVVLVFAATGWTLWLLLVAPLRGSLAYAEAIASTEDLQALEPAPTWSGTGNDRNEFVRLDDSLRALHESLASAQHRLKNRT